MKQILAVGYSQTGQLDAVLDSVLEPLCDAEDIELTRVSLEPIGPYPFPWPFWRFFDTFPETIYEEPDPIDGTLLPSRKDFDLVIFAYQVWFLSPSMPAMAFLQSEQARRLLRGRPVVTIIGCRNMWLMAQEKVKAHLAALEAQLVDNVVLTDSAHSAATFISTPLWMLTGRRGPFLGGLIPAAGIPRQDIAAASRFGEVIAASLPRRPESDTSPMLEGWGAVKINEHLIASEKLAHRSFRLWGYLLRKLGPPGAPVRRAVLGVYVVFLVALILTAVPAGAAIKRLVAPFARERIARQRSRYAAPSGESTERMD